MKHKAEAAARLAPVFGAIDLAGERIFWTASVGQPAAGGWWGDSSRPTGSAPKNRASTRSEESFAIFDGLG